LKDLKKLNFMPSNSIRSSFKAERKNIYSFNESNIETRKPDDDYVVVEADDNDSGLEEIIKNSDEMFKRVL
jgi:hypothetical protein